MFANQVTVFQSKANFSSLSKTIPRYRGSGFRKRYLSEDPGHLVDANASNNLDEPRQYDLDEEGVTKFHPDLLKKYVLLQSVELFPGFSF